MKVIVTDEVSESGLQLLEDDPRFEVDVRLGLPVAELRRLIADYDAIITRSGTQVDRALLENAGQPQAGCPGRSRHRQCRRRLCQSNGVIVVNAPFGNTNSAAEHTMALLLSFCRNVTTANASLKGGEWKRAPFTGFELKGKTAGVIGLGKVGGRVATRPAFEMRGAGLRPVYLREAGR